MTMTAAKCDEWVATTPGDEAAVALSVLNVLVKQGWVSRNSGVDLDALRKLTADFEPAAVAQKTGVSAESIMRMGESFGQSESAVAMAGTDDPALHSAVAILNAVTGNVGKTVVFAEEAPAPASSPGDVAALVKAMAGGRNRRAGDSRPAIRCFRCRSRKNSKTRSPKSVSWPGWAPCPTKRAAAAHLRIPIDHSLETWHDTQPRAGVRGLGQPVMVRVFDSRPLGDILLASAHAGGAKAEQVPWENMADAVNAAWQQLGSKAGGTFDEFWEKARRAGGHYEKVKAAAVKLDSKAFHSQCAGACGAATGLTLVAVPHIFFYDGRGANKPWLQEIPEPVTQLVWDSWVQIHPDTARSLGVSQNGIVELRSEAGAIAVPAMISEHVRPGVLAVPTGQGHTAYGRYANGKGANVWSVLPRWEQGGRGQGASDRRRAPAGLAAVHGGSDGARYRADHQYRRPRQGRAAAIG